ncbi:39_t:CDS:10 [Diversispora eburnea]|uniref:39_t:CDS:1 n=1 Tax=Diversispora eburnea TaxID=1213867 RepID=A0A9N8Z3T9_9GLOM|nr:39_t:CDS:10 [Diversispora eburnea]
MYLIFVYLVFITITLIPIKICCQNDQSDQYDQYGQGWFKIPNFMNFMKKFHKIPLPDNDFPDWTGNFLKLSNEEKMFIEHGNAMLSKFERKHDCFKDAALTLKNGCRNMNLDDDDKILYAVQLTKCEIATANLAVPMECDDIDKEIESCVESLSRIPQLWTSYSGYFREVFHMCFAVRHSLERELLEELHRNITQNQLRNYNILRVQQREMIIWRKEEMSKLIQIEKSQIRILESINETRKTTSLITTNMLSLKDNLSESKGIAQLIFNQLFQLTKTTSSAINSVESLKENLSESQEIAHLTFSQLSQLREELSLTYEKINNEHRQQLITLNQFMETLLEAQQNLEMLSSNSQHEIKLLTQSVSDARESQKDFLKILSPFILMRDFINWTLTSSHENTIKYAFLGYSIPLFKFFVFWIGLHKKIAFLVVIFNMLLIYLYTNNNSEQMKIGNLFTVLVMSILIIPLIFKYWQNYVYNQNSISISSYPSNNNLNNLSDPNNINNSNNSNDLSNLRFNNIQPRIPRFTSSINLCNNNEIYHNRILNTNFLGVDRGSGYGDRERKRRKN